jgi:hypothetical protein
MAGHAYKAAVDELDNVVTRDLDGPFRATVLEPVGRLNQYFTNVNAAIEKRNHKVGALRTQSAADQRNQIIRLPRLSMLTPPS